MEIDFFKYQGTGNDFIIIDDRDERTELSKLQIGMLCDRKTGIGADGLILLRSHAELDFEMIYFNADGSQSFCGNGSRCSIAFADKLHMISSQITFKAIDGIHEGKLENGLVAVKMKDVAAIASRGHDLFVDTGSPHYIRWVDGVEQIDVDLEGKLIRNNEEFRKKGTNVNFAKIEQNHIRMRTYERGVEGETLSCGTGATAVALAGSVHKRQHGKQEETILTNGGELKVRFEAKEDGSFQNIWLVGPAKMVFQGKIYI